MSPVRKGHLPRLLAHHYQGHAVVFWTNTLEERSRGWLTSAFHSTFRELMLHAAAREQLFCPAYCLMPDHLHLVRNERAWPYPGAIVPGSAEERRSDEAELF